MIDSVVVDSEVIGSTIAPVVAKDPALPVVASKTSVVVCMLGAVDGFSNVVNSIVENSRVVVKVGFSVVMVVASVVRLAIHGKKIQWLAYICIHTSSW